MTNTHKKLHDPIKNYLIDQITLSLINQSTLYIIYCKIINFLPISQNVLTKEY